VQPVVIGVMGGSGLYELSGLSDVRSERLSTPFGEPSGEYLIGELGAARLVFLARHAAGHRLLPGEINYRANIHGMKQLGATHLVSVSAVGSMKEEIAPGHLVLVDQFVDRTTARAKSFFGDGVVAHVEFAEPTCQALRRHVAQACGRVGAKVHERGTYLCIDGPQFSTRAESLLYRSWGMDVIGMTAMPEAKLAREAELCYATLALATDYDCWRDGHDAVTVEQVLATMHGNIEIARRVIREVALDAARLSGPRDGCGHALDFAVMTAPAAIPAEGRARLKVLLGSRLP
jgi:5'-methylthioadenosine phosphorylase